MGSIYGNRYLGNKVNLSNSMWFSYPGYNEIFTGKADDKNINSNDKNYNQNKTILEKINELPDYKGHVAAFGSWELFPFIINDKRSGIPVNAGYRTAIGNDLTDIEKYLNRMQPMSHNLFHNSARLDIFTHGYAMEYIKKKHPKVVYISYAQTDNFSHSGAYSSYLHSAHSIDNMLKELWEYVQNDSFYKDKTAFIITTDHGRGLGDKWTSHGRETPKSNEVWVIMYGAGIKARGEVNKSEQHYTSMVVEEIKQLLNIKDK
ncbi:phosphoglyceromutase [Elysia marginata]|uniref:Phosphoglyceromutase n=1 Tax=Elysia marginata TaxID=1093978 RepID=A0AAV4G671_9GAST|nr:phosphoglyceromutase [Elysia marginata]